MQKQILHSWQHLQAAFRLACRGDFERLLYVVTMQLRGVNSDYETLEDLGLSSDRSVWHHSSGGPSLEKVLSAIGVTSSDRIIDFGSGKGGAMISMAKFPFTRISGVEISAELVRIAGENFAKLGLTKLEVECCDAGAFTELDDYTVGYFYCPFPEKVMREVLNNIRRSLLRRPRDFTVIYRNPLCHELVVADETPSFKKIGDFRDFEHPIYAYLHSKGG